MTGGAGFSRDAMNRSASNRSMRTSKRGKFKDGQETYLKKRNKLKFKNVSPEELDNVKREIREKNRAEKKKNLIITFSILILLIVLILYLIN